MVIGRWAAYRQFASSPIRSSHNMQTSAKHSVQLVDVKHSVQLVDVKQ
jgi:hypothetical protein